ncbi:calcium-binding protein [Mycobacterium sp. KBS0706]|uniref:calcium-binding protein n=1 Tax=Mycobacterium sp. KBS0706 TaxID=2578109 RepID=UPI00110F7E67|nr:calcium-binding protein [Mycobacterium sp. KBS0706]TSD89480.1 calcium-binding protein [Mycobacterium sp. KBS0706]
MAIIDGDDNPNTLTGTPDNDTINGFGGDDSLDGGSGGDDVLNGGDGNDVLNGEDSSWGSQGNDLLHGGAGADSLRGNGALHDEFGKDTATYYDSISAVTVDLHAGTGAGGDAEGDTLIAIQNVTGSDFGDTLIGTYGNDILRGGGGDDVLSGGLIGRDVFDGGDGVDTVTYFDFVVGRKVDLATGWEDEYYADKLTSIENLIGSNVGGDDLTGNSGANVLRGEAGNDLLRGGAGADTLDGGVGYDAASYYAGASAVTVDLTTGTGTGGDAQGDTLIGIEAVTGTNAGGDTLTGDANGNTLIGLAGADVLRGGAGDDSLAGGTGNDILDGGAGVDTVNYADEVGNVTVDLTLGIGAGGDTLTDTLIGIENVVGSNVGFNTLIGNSGDNFLRGSGLLRGGAGADRLAGGYGGNDTATYSDSPSAVTIELASGSSPYDSGTGKGGDAEGDTLVGIEIVIGSAFNDTLTGSWRYHETLRGGGGNDLLRGGAGADTLDGGAEVDTATYYASASGVTAGPGSGSGGDAEGDSLSGIENFTGSNIGGDILRGDSGANILSGWGGDDKLYGGAGADRLDGGAGVDFTSYYNSTAAVRANLAAGTASGGFAQGDVLGSIENINGSSFNDTLTGSSADNALGGLAGRDTLTGGGGADRFVYVAVSDSAVGANADLITDFSHAQGDRIDLSGIDANGGGLGNAAFTFIGTGLYTGVAGQLRYAVTSPGVTTIAGDIDGNGTSDFHITLTGNLTLVAGDFVL